MKQDGGGRQLSLDLFMRLLNAVQIPQYSTEAIVLIKSSLEMRLPPLESPPRTGHLSPPLECDTQLLVEHASRVFGRILKTARLAGDLSLTELATASGIEHRVLWRLEHGIGKPPRGSALLQLISALQIPIDSSAAVEVVAAAAIPHLDAALLAVIFERILGPI